MKAQTHGGSRAHKSSNTKVEGPSWVLIAAGALFSTLSIRLGYNLMKTHHSKLNESKPKQNASNVHKGNGKSSNTRKSTECFMQSHGYSLTQDNHGCSSCISGTGNAVELKCPPNGQLVSKSDGGLPLVTVPTAEFNKENGVIWACSSRRLELPLKAYHSNCSDSSCVSESGSDIFSKREVIQKLRQQLKRRDDMILEMQDQISELRNSLNAQLGLSSHLQLQLDAAKRDLFDSKREIHRLSKVIADHCVGNFPHDKSSAVTAWPAETRNGHANGHFNRVTNLEPPEKIRDDDERIEMLRKQVGELKEVIEGKEYLLQSYKEQKAELSLKIREMQQRLDSQLPNIL
ncbi:hypothetical protein Lal_00019710 [Lupinus albus]|uniref:Uncharacterized protein n=1 Tax=Lupinus albus TaxID=3870 RepID=A0A6A4R2K5_LUPAL|nr:hypothetical protein Lalb_Chr01g0000741 [Lupinus albus]KAF1899582.1 hypothetical protein Lal_00019710 [Lupinus albus]